MVRYILIFVLVTIPYLAYLRAISKSVYGLGSEEQEAMSSSAHQYNSNKGNSLYQPHRDVFYLKIHKTGSSTLTTMFYRYVFRHNLTAVPLAHQVFPYSDISHKIIANDNKPKKYNIFAEHTIFDADQVLYHMPNSTVFVASVRHPLALLRSILQEFFADRFASKQPIVEYLLYTNKHELFKNCTKGQRVLFRNTMIRMFGLAETLQENAMAIDSYIGYIDRKFDFVIINEYFDESLILLKRGLRWEMQDIVYIMQRTRSDSATQAPNVAKEVLAMHQHFSAADYKLYDHFLARFHANVKKESSSHFFEELQTFRNIKQRVAAYCHRVYVNLCQVRKNVTSLFLKEHILHLDPRPWSPEFTINPLDCALMKTRTVILRQMALVRQFPELCKDMAAKGILSQKMCYATDPEFKLPLNILDDLESYMIMESDNCTHQGNWHIEAETKWPPFRRRCFQMHFLEWKYLNFD